MNTLYRNLSVSALITLLFSLLVFPAIERGFVSAATSAQIVVHQQVTAELSMTVASTSLLMLPSIPGLTGGTGNSSTTVNVITNNKEGYTVTIMASGTSQAMKGDTQGDVFQDYTATTAETWVDTSAGQASQFGFGLTNTSLSGANGATGYGTCTTAEHCWSKVATTTPKTIVSVTDNTGTAGDTFNIKFRAHIPANSNPLVTEDMYTATTTVNVLMI